MDQKRTPDGWDKEKALAEGVRLNVKRKGSGHPIFLFHGGMGSWTHWIRNIDVLAEHFEVRAVDAPSYGDRRTGRLRPHAAGIPAGVCGIDRKTRRRRREFQHCGILVWWSLRQRHCRAFRLEGAGRDRDWSGWIFDQGKTAARLYQVRRHQERPGGIPACARTQSPAADVETSVVVERRGSRYAA